MKQLAAALGAAALLGSVAGEVTAARTVFSEDFSDNSAGWTLGPTWQIGPATASPPGSAGSFADPGTDTTPTADNGVAGVVIGGFAPVSLHDFYWLESPAINGVLQTGETRLLLSFQRWLNSDYTPYMQNRLDVYNGSAWVNIWATGGSPAVFDSAWTPQSFDITSFQSAAMRVRVGYNIGSSGVYTVSSWNLDDVHVAAVPEPSTYALMALGLAGIAIAVRRRKVLSTAG